MADDILGYRYNPGGLNNQKLAVLGLFLRGLNEAKSVRLPYLYNLDHASETMRGASSFAASYDLAAMQAFADRHDVAVLDPDAGLDELPAGEGWEFFGLGSTYIATRTASASMQPDDVACDFFRSLRPLITTDPALRGLWEKIAAVPVVIQMRIEKDWDFYSKVTLKPTVGKEEDYLPSFSDILAKVANTLGSHGKAFVVCDERSLPVPKDHIRQTAKKVFGFDLFWKSDFLDPEAFDRYNSLELSLVDFEIGVQAETFVGLTRSSFSNLVTFEKYCRDRANVRNHYIYNIPGPYVIERTDNGGYAFARPAVQK